jgi:hypothetical protein
MDENIDYRRQRRNDEDDDQTIMPGMSEAEIERIVRRRVKKRQDKMREFYIHFGIFIFVNAFFWMIWAMTSLGEFPWPFIIMGGWGIGVFTHFMDLTQSFSSVQARRDRVIQQEVEREKERLGIYTKPKRDALAKSKREPMRVADDGELQPLDELLDEDRDDEDEDTPRYQDRQRSRSRRG